MFPPQRAGGTLLKRPGSSGATPPVPRCGRRGTATPSSAGTRCAAPGSMMLPGPLAAGERLEDIVQGYRGRVSREAIIEVVRLVTEQFLKTLPDLEPVG